MNESTTVDKSIYKIAEQFNLNGQLKSIEKFGSGNINDTFLICIDTDSNEKAILQKINKHVFPDPKLVMENMRVVTDHIRDRLSAINDSDRKWRVPSIYTTKDNRDFFCDEKDDVWRAMTFIDRARTYPKVLNSTHAREAGYALGRFQSLVSDLNINKLHDTLVGFHITPVYLNHYDKVVSRNGADNSDIDVQWCLRIIEKNRGGASVLEDAKEKNHLTLRPIHGDPKIDNIMIDNDSGQAVSIIDLDTVKPGLIHYDLGDCLRSCCNLQGEDVAEIDDVYFETEIFKSILEGYLCHAREFLNNWDFRYIFDAVHLIAFELGLRFFTDYLEHNIYFKVTDPEQNLRRGMVQLKLAENIELQKSKLATIINELK